MLLLAFGDFFIFSSRWRLSEPAQVVLDIRRIVHGYGLTPQALVFLQVVFVLRFHGLASVIRYLLLHSPRVEVLLQAVLQLNALMFHEFLDG